MKRCWVYLLTISLFFIAHLLMAAEPEAARMLETTPEDNEPSALQRLHSLHATQADWTFFGVVTNESGEHFNYFFQIQRDYDRFHGIATVIDAQDRSVVIYEDSYTLIEQPELAHWQVGNLFLRFNTITNSWVFGVKKKGKKGFNFKVDMLGSTDASYAKQQTLRPGINLLINQTGRLNGHLQLEEPGKELFVTAKKAWFRQVWVSKPQTSSHFLSSVLCEFSNGSTFYNISIPELDSLRGSIAGWRNDDGKSSSISQFITTQQEKDGFWSIKLSSPKMELSFLNLLNKINETNQLMVGIPLGSLTGFCAITKREIEEHS